MQVRKMPWIWAKNLINHFPLKKEEKSIHESIITWRSLHSETTEPQDPKKSPNTAEEKYQPQIDWTTEEPREV